MAKSGEGGVKLSLMNFLAPQDSFITTTTAQRHKMEDDRAATNLGPEVDDGISEEPVTAQKQPRKRFVGRKAAEKGSEQQADPNASIEDSSAIQGSKSLSHVYICT